MLFDLRKIRQQICSCREDWGNVEQRHLGSRVITGKLNIYFDMTLSLKFETDGFRGLCYHFETWKHISWGYITIDNSHRCNTCSMILHCHTVTRIPLKITDCIIILYFTINSDTSLYKYNSRTCLYINIFITLLVYTGICGDIINTKTEQKGRGSTPLGHRSAM